MKVVLKGVRNGLFFVEGSGFSASTIKTATQLCSGNAAETQACLKRAGLGESTVVNVPNDVSYAVNYVRLGDIRLDGSVQRNDKNPSRRRFATRKETNQHASRFAVRKAKGSDVAGSAGHIGAYVIETTDPVNATINWATGLTNPIG